MRARIAAFLLGALLIGGVQAQVLNYSSARYDPIPANLSLNNTNFYSNDTPTATFVRVPNRFLGGAASDCLGSSSNTQCGYLLNSTLGANWAPRDSQAIVMSRNGLIGFTGASRSSDQTGAATESIGLAGFSINDKDSGQGWALYGDVQRESGSGTSYGVELAIKNKGANATLTPYGVVGGGAAGTIGVHLVGGGDSSYGGTATNPSAVAINITQNSDGQSFNTGINFANASLTGTTGTGTGTGTAIAMARGHKIAWLASTTSEIGNITANATAGSTELTQTFGDGVVDWLNGSTGLFEVGATQNLSQFGTAAAPAYSFLTDADTGMYHVGSNALGFSAAGTRGFQVSGVPSAVNIIRVAGAVTGQSPNFASNGTDTNVGMGFSTQGTGSYAFQTNNFGGTQLQITHTASAVNTISVTGSITGAGPSLGVAGSDTNADLNVAAKGSGLINLNSNIAAGVIAATGATTLSVAGAASTPALAITGTVFTGGDGTTTKPKVLVEPAGTTSTNWNTNGTLVGINAPSGFSGNLIDVQINNTRKFNVGNGGNPTFTGLITGQSGATLTGATAINKNNNAATEIGDGTTTSTVTIGGGSNAVVINSTASGSETTGSILLKGSSSGTVSELVQAAAGTFNWNLPITAGASGDFLTSGGGSATAMTWTTPGTGVATFLTTPTSANLAAALTNETGSGAAVFGTSPTIATPALTGTGTYAQLNGTSTSSTCLTQGANGTTNPVLQLDCSVGSQATGVKLTGNAAGTAATLAAISSGSNEDLGLAGKGTGGVAITGRTSGSAAAAGKVGEVIKSYVVTGSAVSLTTATAANVTSISLTAGDWDVCGAVNFKTTAATSTVTQGGISTTSATMPTDGTEVYSGVQLTLTTTTDGISIPCKQVNVSATTTAYLEAQATFSAGSISAFGQLFARRKE